MVPRTPEQTAADARLSEAVQGVVEAYGLVPEGEALLTEYVVFTCHQGFEEDGRGNARYNFIVSEDGVPWHRTFGLVHMGMKMMNLDVEGAYRADGGGNGHPEEV